MSSLSAPYLHDEAAAHELLEGVLWPAGAVCPHCGGSERITKVKANPEKRIRVGLWRCGPCKKQFTVKVGTVFEASKVKLNLWLQAVVLMTASKKGISAHQFHRTLGVTYKTAWFMEHRIRKAMRSGSLAPFGVDGGAVEVDETFIGNDRTIKPKGKKKGRGYHHKLKAPIYPANTLTSSDESGDAGFAFSRRMQGFDAGNLRRDPVPQAALVHL